MECLSASEPSGHKELVLQLLVFHLIVLTQKTPIESRAIPLQNFQSDKGKQTDSYQDILPTWRVTS